MDEDDLMLERSKRNEIEFIERLKKPCKCLMCGINEAIYNYAEYGGFNGVCKDCKKACILKERKKILKEQSEWIKERDRILKCN